MSTIVINGALAEMALSVKLSGEDALLDSIITSQEEHLTLLDALEISSETFRNHVLDWSQSLGTSRQSAAHTNMISVSTPYLVDIDRLMDHQIHLINDAISTAKLIAILLFFIGLGVFFRYRFLLDRIYRDIDKACAVDTDGSQKQVLTQEIDFIVKRLLRRCAQPAVSPNLLHPLSGMNNQKGLITVFNAKKSSRGSNNVFVTLFEIDQYASLVNTLSKDDMASLFKKLGDIISLYEQPLDVLAHMDDDRIIFVMSRNNKQMALEDCEKIIHSVKASGFSTAKGVVKITLSAGFLLKIPVKSVEESAADALKLIQKAKENGGNRVAQLRDRDDSYH
jgi:GGDEF domain-containing protein